MADRPKAAPAGIYIHIPFCESKCGYCSFVSYANREDLFEQYLSALEKEIDFYTERPLIDEMSFNSLFIGGGTPTVLSSKNLAAIIQKGKRSFSLSNDSEITVECNPNTLDMEKLKTLKIAGVNRLSIGAQSFNNSILKSIGRRHKAESIVNSFHLARACGFENISLDLICGLPGQQTADFTADILEAIKLKADHLSVYQLSVDPGTHFEKLLRIGKLKLPDDDTVLEMTTAAEVELSRSGYHKYEISNFTLPGKECRHNLIYWQNGTYLGLGCAAVSFLHGSRIKNCDDPDHYIKRVTSGDPGWTQFEALPREASYRESVIMGLRLIDGINLEALKRKYGIDIHEYYKETLDSLLSRGLIRIEHGKLRLSTKALPVANQVLAELV